MRKFILVPLVTLEQSTAEFLEIMTEPALFGGADFSAIEDLGIQCNTHEIRSFLKRLSSPPPSCNVYFTRDIINLSDSKALTFALILACCMQHPLCRYPKLIASGIIDIYDPKLSVTATDFFAAKLETLLTMPRSAHSIPWFFAEAQLNQLNQHKINALHALNIQLKPVSTLLDALFDLGMAQTADFN